MKKCSKCNLVKNKDMFHVDKSRKSGLKSSCKACRVNPNVIARGPRAKKSKSEISEMRRQQKMFTKYRIRIEDYNGMFSDQGGCCAICGTPHKKLHIDHCHSSGKVRALLCRGCNVGLGQFKESRKSLYSAIKYLNLHSPRL